ncbi:MAG: fumarate hydratase C-terminal domain-containing protein [Deltaproteobacteria bacterium]|nr:fumarate hydratase C-terminal domain-containing protein [Deltaproteobacteria bacterium]MBW1961094.1 fumarate hydratase C-terminal domain-containing protein [Deltaproteobacteria bacterium]MBW1994481.1 fumarate hydratase C-terminal domain-containing protein [Deltaproteobacteria bacterium]MBW2150488.1 fumarate hydratase C-terminal domain-containing protein [Deltaproteobacteria bacterium]
MKLQTPLGDREIEALQIGDRIEINGRIYCGRDAVLPKIAELLLKDSLDGLGLDLKGSVIFHTAVSIAGIGPTTSNKVEIEGSIPVLSKAGVKVHIGKGSIGPETIKALDTNRAVFAVTPPVSALFSDKIISQRIVAFPEEGMEAFYEIEVNGLPAIVACARGKSLFSV